MIARHRSHLIVRNKRERERERERRERERERERLTDRHLQERTFNTLMRIKRSSNILKIEHLTKKEIQANGQSPF